MYVCIYIAPSSARRRQPFVLYLHNQRLFMALIILSLVALLSIILSLRIIEDYR
jgi:hypothetical protein